jgi:hypothetical protein
MRLLTLAVVICVPLVAFSQEFRATITGVVSDRSQAAVAGARVVVTETRTSVRTATVSDASGAYAVRFLLPGEYEISVTAAGFRPYHQSALRVSAGDTPVVDVVFELEGSAQALQVAADAPIIHNDDGGSGSTISAKEVEYLPMEGGTPIMMVSLALGVISTGQPSEVQPFASESGASWSIAGVPSQQNELLVDGVPNATWDGRLAYSPPRDAVAEMRLKVFETDSTSGHTGGGSINQVLRGGTRQLRGSLYANNKPNTLVGNNFFTNKNRLRAPVTHYNQFGGTAGGPLLLPRVFDGRNRVFWFFAFEGMQLAQPNTAFMSVPTAAERSGDFSKILAAGTVLYDPYSAKLASSVVSRTAFANNKIPSTRLSAIAARYLNYLPAPNITSARADDYNNYGTSNTTRDGFANQFGRLDLTGWSRLRSYINVRHSQYTQTRDYWYDNLAAGANLSRANWGGTLDQVLVLDSANIVNWRLNYTRMFEDRAAPSAGFNPSELGFPAYLAASSQSLQLPVITFGTATTGFQTIGQTGAMTMPSQSLQAYGVWSGMRGRHQLKAGADVRQHRLNVLAAGRSTSEIAFTANTWVRSASNASTTVAKGQDLAEFLMGLPTGGSYEINSSAMYFQHYAALFVQDDWRVRRNLTLNAGLRYDRDFPHRERWARSNNGFAYGTPSPLAAAATAAYAKSPSALVSYDKFNVLGGLTFANPDDTRVYRSTGAFSPRLGFAWTPASLHGRLVVRGGGGVFVAPLTLATLYPTGGYASTPMQAQSGFSQTTSLTPSSDSYLTPYATLGNPFPQGISQPVGASDGMLTYAGQAVHFLSPHMQAPYSLRWTLGAQRLFGRSTVLEVAYTGNRARHIPVSFTQLNGLPAGYLSTSLLRDQSLITRLTATTTNPFYGLKSSQSTTKTLAVNQLLSPYTAFPNGDLSPGTSGVVENLRTVGRSEFHSLNVRLSRRFSRGLQFTANYMASVLVEQASYLNPGVAALERRVSPFDRPQRLAAGAVYELPFRDRRLRGLRLSGIYTFQLGGPFPWLNGSSNNPGDYVYLGADLKLKNREVNAAAFNTAAFKTASTDQFQYHLRTFGTNFGRLRADGTNELNLSLMKDFSVGERVRMQLRTETYNLANHPVFGAPNTQATGTQFGYITSQANRPRTVLFTGRLTF